jgi:peptide/nickel transport system substrate-binding protein
MKRLRISLGAVLLAMAVTPVIAQELRIGLQEDPDVLDPHRARTYVGRIVFTSLCDKLVDINPKLQFVPQLATSWSWSPDNKVLTFKLRTDATFQDGSKFDAPAAKANLDRAMSLPDSLRKSELTSVAKVEAPSADTLVLTLKQPDATLIAQLSDRAGMMLSPKTFNDKDVAAVGRHPICSGPYKFVERVQNDRIVLEKYDGYYDAKDYHFKRITFLPIPDTTVRLSNLRSGDLDMIERMSPQDAAQVTGDSNLTLANVAGLGIMQFRFNVANGPRAKKNPFSNKLVRQAFELSIDRNVINQVIGSGLFEPAEQPFPPASPFHSTQFPVKARNIAKARALLKQAGFDRVHAELAFGNDTTGSALGEMTQSMAAEAGFDLSLRPTEFAAMQTEAASGNFDAMIIGWSGRVDPDGNIYPFVATKGTLNDGHYSNPKLDSLLNEARTVTELDARKKLYDQIQAIVLDDLPDMNIYFQPWPFALKKKIKGFVPYPDGMIRLKGVTAG